MQLKHFIRRAGLRLRQFTDSERIAVGDPFRQIFVDARAVTFFQQPLRPEDCDRAAPLHAGRFCRKRAVGLVLGGAWSSKVSPYRPDRGLLYEALQARYHGGADWRDTRFIEMVEQDIREGKPAWNKCRTIEDVKRRCEQADRLIDSIKRHGFIITDQPIRVNIGPEGQLIKNGNGRHRIALGLITGAKIPVQVLVRHRDWEAIRRRAAMGGRHPDHPDLLS